MEKTVEYDFTREDFGFAFQDSVIRLNPSSQLLFFVLFWFGISIFRGLLGSSMGVAMMVSGSTCVGGA